MDRRDKERGVHADNFWFRGKKSLIQTLLRAYVPVPGVNILNVGAGTGDDMHVIHPFGKVYATDPDEASVAMIPEQYCVEKKVADALHLPYSDGTFDIALAFDVLEHIEDDHAAIAEIRRVLKKDGLFILSVPAMPELFGAHDRALGHFRRYDQDMLRSGFVHGWENLLLKWWNTTLYPLAARKRKKDRAKKDEVEAPRLPAVIDRVFGYILQRESQAIVHSKAHRGLSLVAVFRKR
ncbi:MAG: class I SAM-dependent methyltransferase [Flavobacteriales bacterium]|nr:class I SAM-dependent methyltransferase [Flavobacteriales bacterium]